MTFSTARRPAIAALLSNELADAIAQDLTATGEARISGPECIVNRVSNAIDRAARRTALAVTWQRRGPYWVVTVTA